MKKEIVINASKDRARIAIVEDGELVELYVEHPENVRTLGNIYLGKVAKVMSQIHAAFVDIGQKQDAFLHFSDLTENAAQLFAIAGEDIPGLESGPILAKAPQKRVADDESEPDVEETLEVEETKEESNTSRSRSRRSRRRRGGRGRRGRGGNSRRSEEEEEQEERRLPHVIDLTQKTGSVRPSRAKKEEPADAAPAAEPTPPASVETPGEPQADEAAAEETPKKTRSRSRKKKETPEPETESAQPDAEADEAEAPAEEKPKKTRSRSRKKKDAEETAEDEKPKRSRSRKKKDSDDTSAEDAQASDEAAAEEKPKKTRSRSRKKDDSDDQPKKDKPKASRSRKKKEEAPADDAPEADEETTPKRLPSTIDLTSKPASRRSRKDSDDDDDSRSRSRRGRRNDDEPEATDEQDSDDEQEDSSSRSRRGRGRRSSDDQTTDRSESDEDSNEDDSRSRSRRGRGRSNDTDEKTDDEKDEGDSRSRRGRGRRSSDDDSDDRKGRDGRGRGRSKDSDDANDSDDRNSRGRSRDKSDDSDDRKDRRSGGRNGGRGGGRNGNGRDSNRDSRGGRQRNGGNGGNKSSGPVPTKPDELLSRNGRVLVKITKEPISSKGSRVSTDISLAGRFLVLVPAADYVAVSKKIESAKERRRLRTLATSLKPDNFGVIVRTVAAGREAKVLDQDLKLLVDKWREIEKKLEGQPKPPVLLYEDVNMVSSIVRDLFTEDYDRILVDDPRLHKNLQAYVKAVAPQMADRVVLHKSNQPVFRSAGLEKQVAEAFSERVNMKGGGYLIIETTEAMHVVDVNSGRAGRGKRRAEENLLNVNLEAAREIAKQLRLRDLGGIIVVDFIDLRYERDRRKVTDAIKKEFAKDRAVTKVIGMSDFGVMQITRQRLRPSITTQSDDADAPQDAMEAAGAAEIPQSSRRRYDDSQDDSARLDDSAEAPADAEAPARGTDRRRSRRAAPTEALSPAELAERVRAWLTHYRDVVDERYAKRPIVVSVHPLLGSYLRRGFPSPLTRWRFRLRNLPFRLEDDPKVDPLEFTVNDQKSGRSLLSKYPLEG